MVIHLLHHLMWPLSNYASFHDEAGGGSPRHVTLQVRPVKHRTHRVFGRLHVGGDASGGTDRGSYDRAGVKGSEKRVVEWSRVEVTNQQRAHLGAVQMAPHERE